jgi:hypothetical protein
MARLWFGGRSRGGSPSDDLARRFLAFVAARTPAGQGEWSRAMLAELDHVAGSRARWRFAVSAARVALVPPGSRRLTASVLAAAAVTAGLAVHQLAPQAGLVAAIAVPGLTALCAWVALTDPAALRQDGGTGRVAQVAAVALIVACPALAIRQLAEYPGHVRGLQDAAAVVVFAGAELAAYLLLVLRRPGQLSAGPQSGLAGLAAAAVTGSVFLLQQPPGGQSDNPVVTTAVAATAIGAPLAAGALTAIVRSATAARLGHTLRHAVGEVLWGVLLTGPAITLAVLLTTSRSAIAAEAAEPGFIADAHQQGAVSVVAWVAQDDVGGALVVFTALSLGSMLIFLVSYGLLRLTDELRQPGPGAIAVNGTPPG